MKLITFVTDARRQILESLALSKAPEVGDYDDELLRQALLKGNSRVGATRYEPHAVLFEFAFTDPPGAPVILVVKVVPPERIVFLPVPDWVVENIWQGDVDGSYQFESDAGLMVEAFRSELEPDANVKWFGARQPKRRE